MFFQDLFYIYIFFCFISFFIGLIFFKNYRTIVKNSSLIDRRNLKYGYRPTPTGSGVIFFFIFLLGFFLFSENKVFASIIPNNYYISLFFLFLLCVLCFRDDYKPVDPKLRLIIQIIVIYFSLTSLKLNEINLPLKLSFFLTICIWIYLMNITNFIDGSDGFLSLNAIFFFSGIIFLNYFYNLNFFSFYIALFLLPILILFLRFNKPIAKIYMGDAGSIFLGYMIGFCSLEITIGGYWLAALALNSYMLSDCTITIFKKTLKGYLPWHRLSDYFFLKPILRNKKNQIFVFITFFIFNIFNFILFIIFLKTKIKFVVFLSYLCSLFTIVIFIIKEKQKFSFVKRIYKETFLNRYLVIIAKFVIKK